jgi:hypothetical protein
MMLARTNIEKLLTRSRNKRLSHEKILDEVQRIFTENDAEREEIASALKRKSSKGEHELKFELLQADRIFHLSDIKHMCITYRLRFLDTHYFKGPFPEEVISKIRSLEKEHNTTLRNYKLMAPAKLLKLENADDPLLFVPLSNDYFYLVHKWGNDLHPLRKALMWPFKTFENLVLSIFILSILITMISPIGWFTNTPAAQEYLLLFLFIFKGIAGMVLFYGFAKGKNFNEAIWDSKYYNA